MVSSLGLSPSVMMWIKKSKKLHGSIKLSSNVFREQGKGRPTKKERREIDNIRFDKDLND